MIFPSDNGNEIIVASDVVQKDGADKAITVWDIASVSGSQVAAAAGPTA
jgi:hypothetical protein